MKKNIITMLLLVAATTLYAQDKLVLIDSASIAVRKRSSELSFHDQEMQRLLMPKDAEFGVECVPSFEPEWMLTYSPSAHALIYKVSQENIWYKKSKRYKSPKVNTYKLALADDQAELLRTIWRNAIGQAIDKNTVTVDNQKQRIVHLDGTKWNFFLDTRRAQSRSTKNPHVAFTNALMEAVRDGNSQRMSSLIDEESQRVVAEPSIQPSL